MKRNHSAFKRSTSPNGALRQSTRGRTALPQAGGGGLEKLDKKSTDLSARAAVKAPDSNGQTSEEHSDVPSSTIPKMPSFLQLTEGGKFQNCQL